MIDGGGGWLLLGPQATGVGNAEFLDRRGGSLQSLKSRVMEETPSWGISRLESNADQNIKMSDSLFLMEHAT